MDPNQESAESIAGDVVDTSVDAVNSAEPQGADVSTADSSKADSPASNGDAGQSGPKSSFEAAKAVLDRRAQAESAGDATGRSTGEPSEQAGSSKEGKAPDDGAEEPPLEPIRNPQTASDHRFNSLLKKQKAVQKELEEARPAVENFRQMQQFVQQNGLAPDDLNNAFTLASLLRNDRREAYKVVSEMARTLSAEFGDGDLPPDLQEAVDLGRIDVDMAREMARMKAAEEYASKREKQLAEEAERRQEEQNRQAFAKSLADASAAYVNEWKRTDPDFAKKEPLVRDKIVAMLAQGNGPKNADEVRAQIKAARAEVEKYLASIIPSRKGPVSPLPPSGNGHSAGTRPKSSVEAATAALAAMRQ